MQPVWLGGRTGFHIFDLRFWIFDLETLSTQPLKINLKVFLLGNQELTKK
jgi:hypothetical protein